jgi:DNA-binding transcriptional MerR regulator
VTSDRAERRYTASELAARVGTSERTVRFYVAEGLLPPPRGRGRGAHFREAHLIRLQLIRAIQRAGNELSTIAEYLEELGADGAKDAAALQVWEARQEQAEWAQTWRERFGVPATLYRYRIADGVELFVEAKAAPDRQRMSALLRRLRAAFSEDD